MFEAHNAARSGAGLALLKIDAGATGVARQRALDMASRGYFAHVSPTGETAFSLLKAAGIGYLNSAENIAYNTYSPSQTVEAAMNGLLNSPGHYANIMSPTFKRVGIGVAVAGDHFYYAIVFLNP
jgi:uncharacterized protein YkwD